MLATSQWKELSETLPNSIAGAIESPKVFELVRISSPTHVQAFIEFELILLSTRVSCTNNITDAMVPFIAESLMELYPNASLADIKLCFRYGAAGKFGKLYWLDGVVITEWMTKYLELQATELENTHRKASDEAKRETVMASAKEADTWLQKWLLAIDASPGPKTVSKLTASQIDQEGQEKPKRVPAKSMTVEEIHAYHKDRKLRAKWAAIYHDFYTGRPKSTRDPFNDDVDWIPYDVWLERLRNKKTKTK